MREPRETPTPEAQRKCAEWLVTCLEIGWSRDSLDFLEALWWKHHDNYGELKSAPSTGRETT